MRSPCRRTGARRRELPPDARVVEHADRAGRRSSIPPVVGLVRITDEPLISVDYLGDPHSCIIDTRWLMLNRGKQLKVVLWYDNEWAYSSRVADALDLVAQR